MVKICGATRTEDLTAAAGADLVGLWHGVPGGRADLDRARLVALAAGSMGPIVARSIGPLAAGSIGPLAAVTGGPAPVLVTFSGDTAAIGEAAAAAGTHWVQLHGYQPPGVVRGLLARHPGLNVIKVLHVYRRTCHELALVRAYERVGVSMFLLDSVTDDGRIGSTSVPIEPDVALGVADRLGRPFLLAGGLSADNTARFDAVRRHPRFAGVDVDSGARDPSGRIDGARVAAICREWRFEESG